MSGNEDRAKTQDLPGVPSIFWRFNKIIQVLEIVYLTIVLNYNNICKRFIVHGVIFGGGLAYSGSDQRPG